MTDSTAPTIELTHPTSTPYRPARPARQVMLDEFDALSIDQAATEHEPWRPDASPVSESARITGPIVLDFDEDTTYIVRDLIGAVYGAGNTQAEAEAEFYAALDDHLSFLRANEGSLNPRLLRQFAVLQKLFPDR
jgi:hypothetical protein